MWHAVLSVVWDLAKFVWRAAVAGAAAIGFLIVLDSPIRGNTVIVFWGIGAFVLGMRSVVGAVRRRLARRSQARRRARWESPDGATLVRPQESHA